MTESGLRLAEVKELNRALVMRLICTHPGSTRAFLAEQASLTKMTLTNITNDLLHKDIIEERAARGGKGTAGRNPKRLGLSPSSPVAVGVWISRDFLYGILTDMCLSVIATEKVAFASENTASILEKLTALVGRLAGHTPRRLLGIGVACIGIINLEAGAVERVVNFFDVDRLPIKAHLEKSFDAPIFVSNDMQASALGELYFGLGKKLDSFIYLGVTVGVGSAVIANRQPLYNANSACGEMGHMSMDLAGPRCSCGSRGCLEMYVSTPTITKTLSAACGIPFESFEGAMAYCRKHPECLAALGDVTEKLVYATNNLINIVDVQTVVLGHSAYYFPKALVSTLRQCVNGVSIFAPQKTIQFYKSRFRDKSPLYGAACVVLDRIFCGELPL